MGRIQKEDQEPFTFEGTVLCTKQTDKAILCETADGTKWWIPKSVVDDDSEVFEPGTEGKLIVAGWWAEAQELT